jgi:hypothetical protein
VIWLPDVGRQILSNGSFSIFSVAAPDTEHRRWAICAERLLFQAVLLHNPALGGDRQTAYLIQR